MRKILFIMAAISLGCQKPTEVQSIKTKIPPVVDPAPSMDRAPLDAPSAKSILTRFNPKPPQFFKGPITLETYLATPIMHEAVHALWEKGFTNYAPNKSLGELRRESFDKTEAGRGQLPDWIKATFDESESELGAKLKDLPPPPTWAIREIDELYEQLKKTSPPDEKASLPHFTVVNNFNVNYLPDVPLGNNAIVQMASQFNYLEAPSNREIPVKGYLNDHTQGPQGVIEALSATLYRDAMVRLTHKLDHALSKVLPALAEGYYQNGYLDPKEATKLGQIKNLLNAVKVNGQELRILPQWVFTEGSGATQLQVFSAAPSFQGVNEPEQDSDEAKICIELVSAQYEAIGKLAVIRAIKTGQAVPVHLTLVGQGVFNNPSLAMTESFKKIARVIKGYEKVKIYIHAYGEKARSRFELAYKGNEGTFTKSSIDKLDFAKLPAAE